MTTLIGLMHTGDSISGSVNCYPFQAFSLAGAGDSTLGLTQAHCIYYPNVNLIFRNMGVSGTHLDGINVDDLNNLAPIYADPAIPVSYTIPPYARPRKYIFTTGIGTNDQAIGSHSTGGGSLYAADVATCCVARKAAGYNIAGICTLLPKTAGFITDQDRLDFNATIKDATWRTNHGIDFVIDIASQATMGNPANTTNPTYYEQNGVNGYSGLDGIHPTTAGHALLAPIYLAAINAAIAGLG